MRNRQKSNNEQGYFEWMYDIVCSGRLAQRASFDKLLRKLYNIEFTYCYERDDNRAYDGIGLRRRYAREKDIFGFEEELTKPCSMLEMMLALAIRCEETIMTKAVLGNRTGQWFWRMIVNLGLGGMTNDNFDAEIVDRHIDRFLNHEYESDGTGSLFSVKNSDRDMRELEIWNQMCLYLNEVL